MKSKKMIAAVMYCQDPVIRKLQKMSKRAEWLRRFSKPASHRLTAEEEKALLKDELVRDFESTASVSGGKNKDERADVYFETWVRCTTRAWDRPEDTLLEVAAAAAEQFAKVQDAKQKAAERNGIAAIMHPKKRKRSPEEDAMVTAATDVVLAAAQEWPNDPRFAKLRAVLK